VRPPTATIAAASAVLRVPRRLQMLDVYMTLSSFVFAVAVGDTLEGRGAANKSAI
jgi:hypothetical protein